MLSLNCFSFVISLNSLAFSIATAAWLHRAVNKSKSRLLKGSTPFLVSLLHKIIYPCVFDLASIGAIIRFSSFNLDWIVEVFSLVKYFPFAVSSISLNILSFVDNNGKFSSQLKFDDGYRIGLPSLLSKITPLEAFSMPTERHKTSSAS